MKKEDSHVCPRCDYPLIPVFAVEGMRRRVVALTCPEPYCDHMQMLPRDQAIEYERSSRRRTSDQKAAE